MRRAIQFVLFLLFSFVAHAANVTIDDANPLWRYSSAVGATGWGELYPGHSCSFCLSQPDPTLAHNRTWHDTDRANSASITFLGVAITVYGICPGPLSGGSVYVTNYSFTLDGQPAGVHNGSGCDTLTYDWILFSRSGLTAESHTFTVTNAPPPQDSMIPRSDLLLDYAVYDDGGLVSSSVSSPFSTRSVGSFCGTQAPGQSSSSTATATTQSSGQARLPASPALVGIVLSSLVALATVGVLL
jgi:hypothetical protein